MCIVCFFPCKHGYVHGLFCYLSTHSFIYFLSICSPGKPKVFTDFAYGNDRFFNNVIKLLLVDEFNWYGMYSFEISSERWHVDSFIKPYNASCSFTAVMGAELPDKVFVMDQYSCMSENNWLDRCVRSACYVHSHS